MLSIHKEEKGVLFWQLYSLSNDVVEVVSSQVIRDQVSIKAILNSVKKGMHYLFLSMSGNLDVSDFSQITGILSGYLSLILSDSFFLAST